jgi:hypothetical protein
MMKDVAYAMFFGTIIYTLIAIVAVLSVCFLEWILL